jgi:hypothetical protein
MNQPALIPRRTAAGTPTPSPTFTPLLSPPGGGVGTAVEEDVDVDPAAEAVVLVDVLAGELDWVRLDCVELVEVIVEVLVLDSGLTTSLAVMLKNWLFASPEVTPSKKIVKKKVLDTVRSLVVCTLQVKDVTLDSTFSVK